MSPVAQCPVPFSGTETSTTPTDEDETTSVAVFPPVVAGVNVTCTVQLLPLLSVGPHVVAPVAKLPAEDPTI